MRGLVVKVVGIPNQVNPRDLFPVVELVKNFSFGDMSSGFLG
jgi:hypothetical protein